MDDDSVPLSALDDLFADQNREMLEFIEKMKTPEYAHIPQSVREKLDLLERSLEGDVSAVMELSDQMGTED